MNAPDKGWMNAPDKGCAPLPLLIIEVGHGRESVSGGFAGRPPFPIDGGPAAFHDIGAPADVIPPRRPGNEFGSMATSESGQRASPSPLRQRCDGRRFERGTPRPPRRRQEEPPTRHREERLLHRPHPPHAAHGSPPSPRRGEGRFRRPAAGAVDLNSLPCPRGQGHCIRERATPLLRLRGRVRVGGLSGGSSGGRFPPPQPSPASGGGSIFSRPARQSGDMRSPRPRGEPPDRAGRVEASSP
jgi:hypothetical protein